MTTPNKDPWDCDGCCPSNSWEWVVDTQLQHPAMTVRLWLGTKNQDKEPVYSTTTQLHWEWVLTIPITLRMGVLTTQQWPIMTTLRMVPTPNSTQNSTENWKWALSIVDHSVTLVIMLSTTQHRHHSRITLRLRILGARYQPPNYARHCWPLSKWWVLTTPQWHWEVSITHHSWMLSNTTTQLYWESRPPQHLRSRQQWSALALVPIIWSGHLVCFLVLSPQEHQHSWSAPMVLIHIHTPNP